MTTLQVLTLPGWLNSGPTHWQSRWEAVAGFRRVEQADWEWPRRGDWMARLDEVLADVDAPVALVAHSLGCQLVAAWAAHSAQTNRVVAALLVAPPDTEREDMPPQLFNWRPIVRSRLPFAAAAVCSADDPFCSADSAKAMVRDWGAEMHWAGARGHLNGDSGLGDWPEGLAILDGLLRRGGHER